MYAQVTTVEASPAKLDTATQFFRERVLPELRQLDGFKGFIVLGDRQRGKLLGVAPVHSGIPAVEQARLRKQENT